MVKTVRSNFFRIDLLLVATLNERHVCFKTQLPYVCEFRIQNSNLDQKYSPLKIEGISVWFSFLFIFIKLEHPVAEHFVVLYAVNDVEKMGMIFM